MLATLEKLYEGAMCRVNINVGELSESYPEERGVKQDSLLSLALFLLIMDPIQSKLEESGLGLSVNNFYVGGFFYMRTISEH